MNPLSNNDFDKVVSDLNGAKLQGSSSAFLDKWALHKKKGESSPL